MSDYMKCEHLTKQYDDIYALDDFSMTLEKNKIYGLIGRNGAGKTTLLKILANQVFPTKGRMELTMAQGEKVCLSREVMSSKAAIEYKVKDILYMASISFPNWHEPLKEELVEALGINVKKKYKKLSKGMQTMVGIIIGLSSRATITLFDEPYVGLDPIAREVFYQYLQQEYEAYPRTFIISTHLMNELQNMFEEVILIDQGKMVFHKTMDEISASAYKLEGKEEDVHRLLTNKKVIGSDKVGRYMIAYVMDSLDESDMNLARELDITISGMDLQTLFVKLTTKKGGHIDG